MSHSIVVANDPSDLSGHLPASLGKKTQSDCIVIAAKVRAAWSSAA